MRLIQLENNFEEITSIIKSISILFFKILYASGFEKFNIFENLIINKNLICFRNKYSCLNSNIYFLIF